jgi:hypothetical protein
MMHPMAGNCGRTPSFINRNFTGDDWVGPLNAIDNLRLFAFEGVKRLA